MKYNNNGPNYFQPLILEDLYFCTVRLGFVFRDKNDTLIKTQASN